MSSLPFERNQILPTGKKESKCILRCFRQLRLTEGTTLKPTAQFIMYYTPCPTTPETNIRLLQQHSQSSALCQTWGSFLGTKHEVRGGSLSCWKVFWVYNSRSTSFRTDHNRTECLCLSLPSGEMRFQKGKLHWVSLNDSFQNCVHLTNMHLFLVCCSFSIFSTHELHF